MLNPGGVPAVEHPVEVLLDAALGLFVSGFRRARSAPRPVNRVLRTPWLRVALGIVVVQGLGVVAATVQLVRFTGVVLEDDFLFVLGLFVLPFALLGIGLAAGILGWLVSLVRKLDRCDASARPELAIVGLGAVLVGVPLLRVGATGWGAAMVALGLAQGAIALAPSVWRDRPVPGAATV